jgi:hypothetical protein
MKVTETGWVEAHENGTSIPLSKPVSIQGFYLIFQSLPQDQGHTVLLIEEYLFIGENTPRFSPIRQALSLLPSPACFQRLYRPLLPTILRQKGKMQVLYVKIVLRRGGHHVHNRAERRHSDTNPPPGIGVVGLARTQDRVGVLVEGLHPLASRRVFYVAPDSALGRGLRTCRGAGGGV